ncbi:MAG TPA: hypothetical protein PKV67_02935 [Hyphomonas sp.]|nr:hypothetical protein [Hyphomonas sp.]HRI99702.1 hypothetical protein [Hyphomonas sp.]HRK68012.1 hypothetical protein [Hyphomonas sp.]
MRRWAVAAGLAGMAALAGCQTWHDRADARALEACAQIADAGERARCRETVAETERARQQKALDEVQVHLDEAEERERLHEVFGKPK